MANIYTPVPFLSLLPGDSVKLTDVYAAVDTTDTTQSPVGSTKQYSIQQMADALNLSNLSYSIENFVQTPGVGECVISFDLKTVLGKSVSPSSSVFCWTVTDPAEKITRLDDDISPNSASIVISNLDFNIDGNVGTRFAAISTTKTDAGSIAFKLYAPAQTMVLAILTSSGQEYTYEIEFL